VDDWRARLPDAVVRCVDDLGDGLIDALGPRLVALWLYGAMTFPGSEDSITDIDFHAIVSEPPTDDEQAAIRRLYSELGERHGALGEEIDGFFVVLGDARRMEAPRSIVGGALDTSWALHRAHFHRDQVIVWYGPHPRAIVAEPDWNDIERALHAEFDETLERWPDSPYAVLQTCRVLLSLRRRDPIVSKVEASVWALGMLPSRWHPLIEAAARFYRGAASSDDLPLIKEHASAFVRWGRDEA
jgi:hypothetical protein